jgi:hypothetical protein
VWWEASLIAEKMKWLSRVERDSQQLKNWLELFEEFTAGAGNEDATGHVPLTVFHPLHDAGGLAALWAIRALGRVHHLFTVRCFGDFGHGCSSLLSMVPTGSGPLPVAMLAWNFWAERRKLDLPCRMNDFTRKTAFYV